MKLHPEVEASVEFERARAALANRQPLAALAHLEKALLLRDTPSWYSYLGYCIAKQRGQIKKGIDLCLISLEREPHVQSHYLNLGNIHLISGNKADAFRVFREGMKLGDHKEIQSKLDEIGTRKPPVFKSLSRNNPLNRYLGIILGKIGLR